VHGDLVAGYDAKLEAAGLTIVLRGPECRYRVALNGVETAAQLDMGTEVLNIRASALPEKQKHILTEQLKAKRRREVNSEFSVVIDIDAYHEDPPSPDPHDFVISQSRKFLDVVRAVVSQ